MYIRDFPHVAVGGSRTAAGRRVVGENICLAGQAPGLWRGGAAHPELLRAESLFLWGFICLCAALSSYVNARIRMFLLCSMRPTEASRFSSLEHAWLGHRNFGLHRSYCNKCNLLKTYAKYFCVLDVKYTQALWNAEITRGNVTDSLNVIVIFKLK